MNIFAIEGHKIRCNTFEAGYDYDKQKAQKYLKLNEEYIVDYTIVDSWETTVYLKEVPNIGFNSVFFEDVVEQSDEDNMKHDVWYFYNR